MNNRPNILIISAHQHRADCLGIAGRKVKTPNLDALARSGTRFGSCITPSVATQPARCSILTGQLCQTHGVHDNGIDLDPTIGEKGFAGTLTEAGYDTALFGKANFSDNHPTAPSGTAECCYSSERFDEHWAGPYMGFEHVQLALTPKAGKAPELPPRGQHYERFYHADGQGAQRFETQTKGQAETNSDLDCWHSDLTPSLHSTTWTADRAINWLHNTREKDKPFCAWVSFADLQHPYDCPKPWSLLHDPKEVDLPEQRTLNMDSLPWWYRSALERENSASHAFNDKLNAQQQDANLRKIIANTFGKIAFIDDQIGRILHSLSELGLADNTHVFYLSDHGDWLGDHGLTSKGPMFYDGLLRVPLIWQGPEIPANRVVYEPVSTLDLSPTLLQIAGVDAGLNQHGQSLQSLLDGQSKRDFAMSEWELLPGRVDARLSLRSVRTRTYRLTKDMNSGHGELYDLLADPNEMLNLFDDPASADVRMRLESYLSLRTQDIGAAKAA